MAGKTTEISRTFQTPAVLKSPVRAGKTTELVKTLQNPAVFKTPQIQTSADIKTHRTLGTEGSPREGAWGAMTPNGGEACGSSKAHTILQPFNLIPEFRKPPDPVLDGPPLQG